MVSVNAEPVLGRIRDAAHSLDREARLMEVCGTHTHAIGKGGLRTLLPTNVELVSGPGCPVCVTSQADIERMLLLARQPGVILATFGDMLRVPGVKSSLEKERSQGADVRVVYSPLDVLTMAEKNPKRQIVFLAVGFETTSPGVALVILRTYMRKLENLSFYVSHKLIIPAMNAVMRQRSRIDGFLTPGHVSVIIGAEAYETFAKEFDVPCVATGFEPFDVLEGVAMLLESLSEERVGSFVQYSRAVKPKGNPKAWETLMEAYDIADADWRGLGIIPDSGLKLKEELQYLDAAKRFGIPEVPPVQIEGCRCGEVLRGLIHPPQCALFGRQCTPRTPLGPCMVSSEGACSARYRYG